MSIITTILNQGIQFGSFETTIGNAVDIGILGFVGAFAYKKFKEYFTEE